MIIALLMNVIILLIIDLIRFVVQAPDLKKNGTEPVNWMTMSTNERR